MKKVMIVEDEYAIRHIVSEYFQLKNTEVVEAMNGFDALEKMNDEIEVVLLDIMMPGINGYDVCEKIIAKYSIPIIFISALSQEEQQLQAFSMGAYDYVTKPFLPSVLYAKCLVAVHQNKKNNDSILTFGELKIDTELHQLIIDGQKISLTPKEFELLSYLYKYEGKVISRERLLDQIWGYDYYEDGRAVDTYIKKLRKKLGKYATYIHTVVKTGYMFKMVEE